MLIPYSTNQQKSGILEASIYLCLRYQIRDVLTDQIINRIRVALTDPEDQSCPTSPNLK